MRWERERGGRVQPTVDAELAGVRRSLAALVADESVGVEVRRDLQDLIRTLQRLESSWSRVLPYLTADNARMAALLHDLAPLVPTDLRLEIEVVLSEAPPAVDPACLDIAAVNDRSEALRALVSRGIGAQRVGHDVSIGAMHARVAACLRESLQDRPW